MTFHFRKSHLALPLLCFLGSASLMLHAQDDGSNGPPKVLLIQREYTKPGKGGALHGKTEAAFIAALKAHNGSVRYFAMDSLSGPYRALFFSGYSSFAAWEADNKAVEKDPALGAAMDRANVADGDLLSSSDQSVWTRKDSMSYNMGNLVGKRYMELELFQIKPGREKEWEDAVKLVTDGYKKGIPETGWVMYEQAYGTGGNLYLVITTLKSMAEIDSNFAEGHKFVEAMGAKGMEKLEELSAASIESQQTNLFQIDPKMSYPPESWISAEPDFWKPRAAAAPKKPTPKPAP